MLSIIERCKDLIRFIEDMSTHVKDYKARWMINFKQWYVARFCRRIERKISWPGITRRGFMKKIIGPEECLGLRKDGAKRRAFMGERCIGCLLLSKKCLQSDLNPHAFIISHDPLGWLSNWFFCSWLGFPQAATFSWCISWELGSVGTTRITRLRYSCSLVVPQYNPDFFRVMISRQHPKRVKAKTSSLLKV